MAARPQLDEALAGEMLGSLRLEDDRPWLDAAHDFQREDMFEVLDGDRPYHFLTRARGCSKTTDLAGGALAVLAAAVAPLRCYWLAADRDQARLALDAIVGFLSRSQALQARVTVGSYRVVGPHGATLEILPADTAGSWGLSPDFIFIDELSVWVDTENAKRLWFAMSTAAAKRGHCRMVVLCTAGSPDHFSYLDVLEPARKSSMWRVSERAGPAPWMSEERLEEQRQRLPDSVYRQLFLNEWTSVEGAFLDPDAIDRAFILDGPPPWEHRHVYHAALDLGSVNDPAVFAVGHKEGVSRVVLDGMVSWQGSKRHPVDFGMVEATIVQAHSTYHFGLTVDPWQALDMMQRLRAQGVPVGEYTFTQPSKQRLAQTLLSLLNAGNLALYSVDGLRKQLLGLRLVQASNGAWGFDHKPGSHDDMAVSLSMMAVKALEGPGPAQALTHRVAPAPGELPPLGVRLPGEEAMVNPQGRSATPPPGWPGAGQGLWGGF